MRNTCFGRCRLDVCPTEGRGWLAHNGLGVVAALTTRYPLPAVALLLGLAACSAGEADKTTGASPVVNFYNWYNDTNPTALADFTRQTGVAVIHDVYDSDEILEGKLLVGHSKYDLVVPSSTYFARQLDAGLFHEIDHSKLQNYRELDPDLLARLSEIDPGNRYGVPYNWGTTGFGFNVDRIRERMPDAPVDSWAMVFDPEVVKRFEDCGVAFLDSPADVVPSALAYLGRDPGSHAVTDLHDAVAAIASIQPFVRYFYSSQIPDDLASGEVCLALTWSGSVFQAQRANKALTLKYVIPREGALVWFELMAIPADAANVDSAHRLIDFLLQPKIAAGYTNTMFYPSGVASATQFVDADIRAEPAMYPSTEVRQRLFSYPREATEYERRRLRLWDAMKAGQPLN